ncbi:BnaA07g04600D [Brassica napus]|uniref:BnaA07g04600D protein n=1 Tax=Brassica napus TaxID=3708 RepID=A0A078GMQ7_BRANA|nr:BnaA07g04600D [Brassica napus]
MSRQSQLFTLLRRRFHSPSSSDAPTETLRKRITDLQKSKKRRNPIKNQFLVEVPESRSYLDTATMPMFLAVVGIALFAKVLMMIDDSKSQEMIERKIKNAPEGQGTVRMIEPCPPNAQIRTGEPVRKDDLKNWTIDVLTNALSRTEESVRRGGSS